MNFSAYEIECIEKSKKIINSDISRHFSIFAIAASVGMGATKLKKGFKDLYGMGLFAYLRQQRMLQAAALLVTTHKTIKEIARNIGFRYRGNFITAFSSYYGISPARYRKLHSKT